jgi:hypothetical protein
MNGMEDCDHCRATVEECQDSLDRFWVPCCADCMHRT